MSLCKRLCFLPDMQQRAGFFDKPVQHGGLECRRIQIFMGCDYAIGKLD